MGKQKVLSKRGQVASTSPTITSSKYGLPSVIFGVIGIFLPILILPSILALVFAYKQRKIQRDDLSTAGLVLGWIGIGILFVAIIIFGISIIIYLSVAANKF